MGIHSALKKVFFKALPIFEKISGKGSWDVANVFGNLALAKSFQAKYPQVIELNQKALKMLNGCCKSDNERISLFQGNLAEDLHAIGEFEQAHTYFRKALTNRTAIFGPNHPDVVDLLANYAFSAFWGEYRAEDDPNLAKTLILKAYEITKAKYKEKDIFSDGNNIVYTTKDVPSLYAALSILDKSTQESEKIFEAVQLIRQK